MTEVEIIEDLNAIELLRESWCQLRLSSKTNGNSIDQYLNAAMNDEQVLSPLVTVIRVEGVVVGILPFAVYNRPRKFVIGELKLFSITHRVVHISGAMLGSLDIEQAQMVLEKLARLKKFDSVNLYEIATSDNIYKSIETGKLHLKTSSMFYDIFPHWVVDFPGSFDAYMAGFRSKTRSTLKRKVKQFDGKHRIEFEKITQCKEIGRFLEIGEAISRQTYQWDLGTRLINNEASRRKFEIIARQNELYCYLLHADGIPIAFTWGFLINDVFHYETPGFLREYSRWSPGTVMLMKIFEDLLENTTCRCFDFGMGGDFTGYKAQFGNRYYDASIVEIYPCKTFKSQLLYLLDRLFWLVKRTLRRLVSPRIKSQINQVLRKFGILK